MIPGDYYRALYSYNPTINSPNQDAGVEEELNFEEDDIIIVSVSMVTYQYVCCTFDCTLGVGPSLPYSKSATKTDEN